MSTSVPSGEGPTYHAVVTSLFFVAALGSAVFTVISSSLESQVVAVVFSWIFIALGVFALIGGFVGKAARRKGRSFHAFFWLSLLVNPLIMAIVVAAISPAEKSNPGDKLDSSARELERLARLREEGAITEEEFAKAKAQLLGNT